MLLLCSMFVFSPLLIFNLMRKYFPDLFSNLLDNTSKSGVEAKIANYDNCLHENIGINIINYLKNSKFNLEESQEVQTPTISKSKHLSIDNVDTSGSATGSLNMVDANLNLYNIIANARRKCSTTPPK